MLYTWRGIGLHCFQRTFDGCVLGLKKYVLSKILHQCYFWGQLSWGVHPPGGGVKKFGKSFEHFLEISGKFVYKEAIKSVFWGVVGRFISKISKDTFFGRKIHLPTAKKFEIHLPRCRDPLPQINTVLHPKSIILIPLALTNSWKYVTDSKLFSPKMTDSVNFLKKWWIGEQIGILNFSAYILKSLLWVRLKIYLQFFKKKKSYIFVLKWRIPNSSIPFASNDVPNYRILWERKVCKMATFLQMLTYIMEEIL